MAKVNTNKSDFMARMRKNLARAKIIKPAGSTAIPDESSGGYKVVPWVDGIEHTFKTYMGATDADIQHAFNTARTAWNAMQNGGRATDEMQLNALRMINVWNFAYSELLWPQFNVETITLAPDEEPVYIYNTKVEVNAIKAGDRDNPPSVQVLSPNVTGNETIIPLEFVRTSPIEYPIYDIQKGTIGHLIEPLFNQGRDLNLQLGQLAFKLGTAGYGAFNTSGAAFANTYNLHSMVDVSQIPTTNDLNLTSLDASGTAGYQKITTNKLTAILAYQEAWNRLLPEPVELTGDIIIPASHATDILSQVSIFTAESDYNEQVEAHGFMQVKFGKTWRFWPDSSIQVAPQNGSGGTGTNVYIYPRITKPSIHMLRKPAFDSMKTDTDDDANRIRKTMRACVAFYQPEPFRPYAVRARII